MATSDECADLWGAGEAEVAGVLICPVTGLEHEETGRGSCGRASTVGGPGAGHGLDMTGCHGSSPSRAVSSPRIRCEKGSSVERTLA